MRLLIICFIFLPLNFSFAKKIDLPTYLELLKKNDIQLKSFIHQNMQTEFQANLRLPSTAWVLALTNEYGLPEDNLAETSEFSASLEKSVLNTGTDISLNYNQSDLEDRDEKSQSIELEQSLVKNAFGYQSRKLKKLLGEQNKVLKWQVVESYEAYLEQKIGEYLDYILAYENYQTVSGLLKDINKLAREVRQRKKSGVANNVDVYRMTAEVLDYKKNVFQAELDMKDMRRKLFVNLKLEKNESIPNYEPNLEVPYLSDIPNFETDTKNFWDSSRSIKILKSGEKTADLEVKVQKNDLYPELNLTLGYQQQDSTRFSIPVVRDEALVGLNFTYAFDNNNERAELRKSKFDKKQLEYKNISQKQLWKIQIKNLEDQTKIHQKALKLFEQQESALKKLVREERKRFLRGRIALETLVDAQNRYTKARYDLTSQKVKLAKSIVAWKSLMDQLIDQKES